MKENIGHSSPAHIDNVTYYCCGSVNSIFDNVMLEVIQSVFDFAKMPLWMTPERLKGSIFGDLVFERAYFYASGEGGECSLEEAMSLPERWYSDLLMESAELLGVEGAYQKGLETLAHLLLLKLPKLALETGIAEHSQMVKEYYDQKKRFPKLEEGPILVAQADGKGLPLVMQETEK